MDEREVQGERLARVEEQMKGVREDFADFRTEMRNMWSSFTQLVSNMQKEIPTRIELEKELALRDQRIAMVEKAQETALSRKSLLWITLGGAFVGGLVTGLITFLATKG